MEAVFVWFALSIFIGMIGSSRNIGFWGGFLISLFFSPLIGLIVTLVSKSESQKAFEIQTMDLQKKQLQATQQNALMGQSVSDELRKLKVLYDEGLLTSNEYEAQRIKLLGR